MNGRIVEVRDEWGRNQMIGCGSRPQPVSEARHALLGKQGKVSHLVVEAADWSRRCLAAVTIRDVDGNAHVVTSSGAK